jgi:hypothetical protein
MNQRVDSPISSSHSSDSKHLKFREFRLALNWKAQTSFQMLIVMMLNLMITSTIIQHQGFSALYSLNGTGALTATSNLRHIPKRSQLVQSEHPDWIEGPNEPFVTILAVATERAK